MFRPIKLSDNSRKSRFAASLAGIVEWYDFTVYGNLASIFAIQFFPSHNHNVSLIAAFGAFASGFFMRFIGSLVLSHLGDRHGKARILRKLIPLISVPTILIGLTPTYQQIGLFAPCLIVALRMLQGFMIGGQVSGSLVYVAESTPNEKRGHSLSIVWLYTVTGVLLGVAVSYVFVRLVPSFPWIWRIPFLLAIVPFLLTNWFSRHITNEKPPGSYSPHPFPLKTLLKKFFLPMLTVFLLLSIMLSTFYVVFIYTSSYLVHFSHISLSTSLLLTSLMLVVSCFLVVVFGYFSDRRNIANMTIIISSVLLCISAPIIYRLLINSSLFTITLLLLYLSVLVSAPVGAILKSLPSLFPVNVRFTGVAFPYSVQACLVAGMAPFVISSLIYLTSNSLIPAYFISVASFLSLVGVFLLRKQKCYPILYHYKQNFSTCSGVPEKIHSNK